MAEISIREAISKGLREELDADESVFLMGEDIGGYQGPYAVTNGFLDAYGPDRIRDTPISEAGFMGAGVGAAATGLRPIVDLMFVGFFGVCGDQITNNAAKMRYMFGGKITLPLTIMTSIGAGSNSAAQHSETLYSIFTHFPGLKCVVPSDPYSAKGLMVAAIRDNDPVMIFNHKILMGGLQNG